MGPVLLAVLGIVCVVLVALNVARIQASQRAASQQASTYAPPAVPAPSTPVVTVLGDGGLGDVGTLPTASSIGSLLDGADVRMQTTAGARYIGRSSTDEDTFEAMARSADPASASVVLFGGIADRGSPLPLLATAVTRAVAAAHARAPKAEIVLVGPVWTGSEEPPKDVRELVVRLRSAAAATSARWVDPIGADWLTDRPGLLTDGGDLTRAGTTELGRRLAQAIRPSETEAARNAGP